MQLVNIGVSPTTEIIDGGEGSVKRICAVGWVQQQALAPLAPPTICCKTRDMDCQTKVGDKLAKARFYPPYDHFDRKPEQVLVRVSMAKLTTYAGRKSGDVRYLRTEN